MFRIILAGAVILNLLGLLMDITGIYGSASNGYYSSDIRYIIHFPYWLFANIVFIATTLIAAFFFTVARFHLKSTYGNINGRPSVILVVILILIPALLISLLLVSPDKLSHGKLMDVLLNKRVVYLDSKITEDEAERIIKSIARLNAQDESREITLYINSNGGIIIDGMHIYDAIKQSKAPVTGIVMEKAISMAVVVLQACKTRKAHKHSNILIHNITISRAWHKLGENLEEELKTVRYIQKNLDRLIVERSGLPVEKVQELSMKETILQADEAKELGLIDEVI